MPSQGTCHTHLDDVVAGDLGRDVPDVDGAGEVEGPWGRKTILFHLLLSTGGAILGNERNKGWTVARVRVRERRC